MVNGGIDPVAKATLGKTRPLSPNDIESRIKQFRQNLWKDLIPDDLKSFCATQREAWWGKTIVIVSEEPCFPWELLWPYPSGKWEEWPWCMNLRLTRWPHLDAEKNGDEDPPVQLRLSTLACLAPNDSALPVAQKERNLLKKLASKLRITDESPKTPTRQKVRNLSKDGGYD